MTYFLHGDSIGSVTFPDTQRETAVRSFEGAVGSGQEDYVVLEWIAEPDTLPMPAITDLVISA